MGKWGNGGEGVLGEKEYGNGMRDEEGDDDDDDEQVGYLGKTNTIPLNTCTINQSINQSIIIKKFEHF